MKKILHFHPNGNAASNFVAPLMQAEKQHGFSTKIITSIHSPRIDGQTIAYDLSLRNLLFLPLSFLAIINSIRKFRPDIVISHNSKSSFFPLSAARLCGVKNIIYFNHGVPFIGYNGFIRAALLLIERLNLFLAIDVITVGPSMQKELAQLSPKNPKLIAQGSACGFDLTVFDKKNYSNSTFRERHSIDKDNFIVTFIGRAEQRKGFGIILDLIQNADVIRDKNIKLLLCGPSNEDVIKLIGKVPENVIALGYCDNIAEVLAACQCLILPSFHEGLPYVCIEAQLMECLVVANKIPGICDVVRADETGYLIEGNDLQTYKEIIITMSRQLELSKDLILAAKQQAEKYDRKFFMQDYISFLSSYNS